MAGIGTYDGGDDTPAKGFQMETDEASARHPHEPEMAPVYDAEGRCLVCGSLVVVEGARPLPLEWVHAVERMAGTRLTDRDIHRLEDWVTLMQTCSVCGQPEHSADWKHGGAERDPE